MAFGSPVVNPSRSATPRTVVQLQALQQAISPARLQTYLRQTHFNSRRALALYEWNTRAGAALYPVLQVNEVVLRNAVNAALLAAYGASWPTSAGFLRALPARERAGLEAETRNLKRRLGKPPTVGDVVAAQTYWFWVFMFTHRFEDRIWSRRFPDAFPHAPHHVSRAVVHQRAESIRRLRNRIAHHEPLLSFDLPGAYQRALSLVRWICPVAAEWTAERWPLRPEVATRP
jgi:hypothetical protein